jgi:type I restriction enzyme S subunit
MTTSAVEQPVSLGWLYEPTFPSSWKSTPLFPLATWINGMAFKNIHFSPTGRPVIKIAEVKNGVTSQTRLTDSEYPEKYLVDPGSLIFSWSGQPETSIGVFVWRGVQGWLNQHLFKVIPDAERCDPQFFRYLLEYLSPNFIGIARNKQTTGLGHVTKRDLQQMTVRLPDLPTQRQIGACLDAMDGKLELNERRVGLLDALFGQLFTQTQLGADPGHTLPELATFRKGVSYRSADLEPSATALVTLKSFGRDGGYKPDGLKPWTGDCKPDQVMKAGELAVAQTDLTQAAEVVGRVIRVPSEPRFERLVASLDLTIVRPQEGIEVEYLLGTLLERRFREHCRSRTHGTTVLHLAADALPSYQVVLADPGARSRFASVARILLERRDALNQENDALTGLRRATLLALFSPEQVQSHEVSV